MKAAVYYETGPPDVFRYEDVPDPVCPAGGVVIDVEAISIEGGDVLNRAGGEMPARPHIVGYEVTNSLSISTGKLALAGELIEAANEAGANSIDAIVFDLANPRTHRAEAIAAAATNARSDAGILARSSGVKLARVLSVSLDDAGRRPFTPTAARAGMAMAQAAVAPPIRPGDVTVRASVTIVYEIEETDQ